VAQRTGLIPPNLDVGPAHAVLEAQLPPDWNAQQVYDNHEVLMLHGQRVCFFKNPACDRCVLLEVCPTGQARMEGRPIKAESPRKRAPAQPGAGAKSRLL
jgi:endonuclease-3